MKKIKSLSLVVIMALLVGLTAVVMVGCDNTEVVDNRPVEVYFQVFCEENSRHEFVENKIFFNNKTFEYIAEDIGGYNFDGWYTDKECTNKFDMENTKLTEPLSLYGKYVLKEYTVTFIIDGKEEGTQKVKHDEKVNKELLPTKVGHKLHYWFENENLMDYASIDDEITKDVSYYSQWKKLKFDMSCEINVSDATPYRMDLEYGDCIETFTSFIEEENLHVYSDGWFFDEEHTMPVDIETYTVTKAEKLYWKTRINLVNKFALKKLADGTFAIGAEYGIELDKTTDIAYIPDSFIDKDGNNQIISTIKSGIFEGGRGYSALVFGKNIVNVEENAFGIQYRPDGQYDPFLVFFANDSSKMNLADNIIHPKTQAVGGVAVYYGEKYLINDEYIYQNTGNDIVILKHIGQNPILIPKTIDGVAVTKINSTAIGSAFSRKTIYIQDNIKIIMPNAFRKTDIYCIFAESEVSGFSKDWQGYGSTITFNATIPPELLG